eukprot:134025-Chlamydomonas_euryale.AAC.2
MSTPPPLSPRSPHSLAVPLGHELAQLHNTIPTPQSPQLLSSHPGSPQPLHPRPSSPRLSIPNSNSKIDP